MALPQSNLTPGAGWSLDSKADRPDRVPLEKGEYSIASRALALSTYFLSGALCINLSQFLGGPLRLVNEDWYNAWIAWTKQSFGLLTMTLTQAFAPTKVIVSGDKSVRGQLLKSADGNLILDFPERLVLIANHQIYTDWMYLWWIAYCNGMHGRLYIILKESLKRIPVLGWGMQLSQFIFLKRNWEEDKPHMTTALQRLNKAAEPMWLLLFPEGTNLAPSTRERSAAWAKKNNMADMRHLLLPRSTGLKFCVENLKSTIDYVYDCTVAYEGVPHGEYAQDIFTLKAGYLEGRPPKSVAMHWRRFAIKDIPLHDDKAFELWLTARWREKDILMEHYMNYGNFPADVGATKYRSGKVARGCGHMVVPIRASHWYEFLQIFAPMGVLAMVLFTFYNALPQRFWKSINKQALESSTQEVKKIGQQTKDISKSASRLTLDDIFDADKQGDSFKKGALAVQGWLNSPGAQTLMNRVDYAQKFLENPEQAITDSVQNKEATFEKALQEEEARRLRRQIKGSKQKQITGPMPETSAGAGSFWKQIEAEEKSRTGSVLSAPSRNRQGNFYQNLKDAEARRAAGVKTGTPKRNFWDELKTEQNSRFGTVVTLSSDATTAVNSTKSGDTTSIKQPPKLGTASVKSGSISKTPNKVPVSTVKKPATQAATASKPTQATQQPAKAKSKPASGASLPKKSVNAAPVKKAPAKLSPGNPTANKPAAQPIKKQTPNGTNKAQAAAPKPLATGPKTMKAPIKAAPKPAVKPTAIKNGPQGKG